MALLSAFTLIRTISLFHITAAYFFLTAPRTITDQNVVFVMGESMRLPPATSFDMPTDATAFIAVLLAFLGISDLTAAALDVQTSLPYWLAAVPTRLAFLFVVTGYSYFFKAGGLLGPSSTAVVRRTSPGETLQNGWIFTWGFIETAVWFWIFTSLREEREQYARRRLEEIKAQEDRLEDGENGENALYAALCPGHTDIVRRLLDRGPFVVARYNGSALQAASRAGYTAVVSLFLERGADANGQIGTTKCLWLLRTTMTMRTQRDYLRAAGAMQSIDAVPGRPR